MTILSGSKSNDRPQKISLPSYFEESGYTSGIFGHGEYVLFDGPNYDVYVFSYLQPVVVMSSTMTIASVSVSANIRSFSTQALQYYTGPTVQTQITVSATITDQPITYLVYAIGIILIYGIVAMIGAKTTNGMLVGITMGVCICTALGLIPIWMIALAIIAAILAIVFGRRGTGEIG
jgi:hypothetical protein